MAADRGHDTSRALTEIRAVLGRAGHARERLNGPTEPQYTPNGEILWDDQERWVTHHDPDAEEMRAALDETIRLLSKWRRTGRPKRKS